MLAEKNSVSNLADGVKVQNYETSYRPGRLASPHFCSHTPVQEGSRHLLSQGAQALKSQVITCQAKYLSKKQKVIHILFSHIGLPGRKL